MTRIFAHHFPFFAANEVENILDTLLRLASVDQYDYVIVETSGLADPGPIIQTMMRMGGGKFFIDGVVTLVDAKNISSHLEGSKYGQKLVEAERYARALVLSKCVALMLSTGRQAIGLCRRGCHQ